MPSVTITETLYVADRHAWREWLAAHHANKSEIWLIYPSKGTNRSRIPYLHAVEEAICFGWIDGIEKRMDSGNTAQRFTPRRPKSNWTELNKKRARRLIAVGLMTEAGYATLPDLSLEVFQIAPDILETLRAEPEIWNNFQAFPDVYKRIRIGYIEEMRRRPQEFEKRLNNFLKKTRENKIFGAME